MGSKVAPFSWLSSSESVHWLECSPFVVPRQGPARLLSPATPQGSPFIQRSVRLLCTCHAPGNVLDLGERVQWSEQTETLGLLLWVLSSTKVPRIVSSGLT